MEKMTIIEVDLNIENIISDDLEEITEENKKIIDQAIAEKKQVSAAKLQQTIAKATREQNIHNALEKAYQLLVTANSPVGMDLMISAVLPDISNSSALVLQLKTYIRKHKNNQYVLKKHTIDGKTAYSLIPYNVGVGG